MDIYAVGNLHYIYLSNDKRSEVMTITDRNQRKPMQDGYAMQTGYTLVCQTKKLDKRLDTFTTSMLLYDRYLQFFC